MINCNQDVSKLTLAQYRDLEDSMDLDDEVDGDVDDFARRMDERCSELARETIARIAQMSDKEFASYIARDSVDDVFTLGSVLAEYLVNCIREMDVPQHIRDTLSKFASEDSS